MNRKAFIVFTAAGIALAIAYWLNCRREDSSSHTIRWPVMGTIAQVTIRGQLAYEDNQLELVRYTYYEVERKLSAWNPDSELCRLAAADCTNWTASASPEMRPCYAAALRLAAESQQAFNPYMGRILRQLGVGKGKYSDFDLGAIAKGFAVDLAAERITPHQGQSPSKDLGPSQSKSQLSLLLDLGGNLRVIGNRPWRTGIRNPFAAVDSSRPTYCAVITLTNGESVATSGNYERFIEKDGRRLSHILDGRTGLPTHGLAAVTVVTPSDYGAMLADGLSTTLFVLGPEKGGEFLAAHYPRALALWIPDTPNSPQLLATPLMRDRLQQPAYPVQPPPLGKTP